MVRESVSGSPARAVGRVRLRSAGPAAGAAPHPSRAADDPADPAGRRRFADSVDRARGRRGRLPPGPSSSSSGDRDANRGCPEEGRRSSSRESNADSAAGGSGGGRNRFIVAGWGKTGGPGSGRIRIRCPRESWFAAVVGVVGSPVRCPRESWFAAVVGVVGSSAHCPRESWFAAVVGVVGSPVRCPRESWFAAVVGVVGSPVRCPRESWFAAVVGVVGSSAHCPRESWFAAVVGVVGSSARCAR